MLVATLALVLALSTPQAAGLPLDTMGLEPAGSWPFGEGTTVVIDTTRHLVCMASGCGVLLIDVSDPAQPTVLSDRIRCQSQVWSMWLDGTKLYLAMATWMLEPSVERDVEIWDIGDATGPVRLSSLDLGVCAAVWSRDSLLLVSSWGRFLSYDVSDPRNPVLLCSVNAPAVAYRIAVRDTLAFLSVGLGGVRVFSVADPGDLKPLAAWGNANVKEPGMAIDGDLLYQVATYAGQDYSLGMRIYDISDPSNGQLLGAFDTMPYASPYRLVVRDTIAAVAYRGSGLKLVSVADPVHPYEIAAAGDPCRDVVWVDTLAYLAGSTKLEVVNLADPSRPSVVASLATRQAGQGVALARNAVLTLGSGLTVLGEDPTGDLRLLARLDTPAVSAALTAFDTVAVASFTDSFAVIGVSDPGRPSVLSKVSASYARARLYDTLCYVAADSGLRVYSLARPRDPELLGSAEGPSWVIGAAILVDSLVLVGAEELSVFDVSDPRHPLWLMDTVWEAACFTAQDTFAYTISSSLDSIKVYSIADGQYARELGAQRLPYHTWSSQDAAIAIRDTLLVAAVPTWLGIYSVAEPLEPRCLYQSRTPFPAYGVLLLSHDTLYAALGNRGLFRYRLVSGPSGLELEPVGGISARPLRVWPNVVNRQLNLAGCQRAVLVDASGRKVLDLKSGPNDVRALAPGVYFVSEAQGQAQAVRKVVVTR